MANMRALRTPVDTEGQRYKVGCGEIQVVWPTYPERIVSIALVRRMEQLQNQGFWIFSCGDLIRIVRSFLPPGDEVRLLIRFGGREIHVVLLKYCENIVVDSLVRRCGQLQICA